MSKTSCAIALLAVIAVVCISKPAQAQIDAEVLLTRAELLAFNNDTDTDPTVVAVTTDGVTRYVYESQGGADPANSAIIAANGGQSVYLSRSAINSALSTTSPSILDVATDSSGNLFAVVREWPTHWIIRVPSAGTIEQVVAGTGANDVWLIDVDEANSRLVVWINGTGLAGVATTATAAALNVFATDAAMGAVITPAQAGVSFNDIVVQADGDVLAINYNSDFGSGDDGDIVHVTAGGTVSLFTDRSALTAAIGNGGSFLSPYLEVNSSDEVIVAAMNSSDFNAIVKGSADGSSWNLLVTEATIMADPDVTATNLVAKGLAMDSTDRLYFTTVVTNEEALIRLSGTGLPVELLSFEVH